MSVQGDVMLGFDNLFFFPRNLLTYNALKLSILDSQSFVLHKNGIEFHQECNGSIHIKLVTSYDVVWYS